MNSIFLNHGRYDAAIVDLDGTMVDTMGDFVVALDLMLAEVLPQGLAARHWTPPPSAAWSAKAPSIW
ncbi:hypothetical protein ABLV49_02845 [Polaromonas hydrogenivorans]|uniref:Phosphoglycolate phosphatase n=1 Tax=Polaromonas hydrogenivorans TaxID=335476 RepID=A0AAU7LT26_9BURK